MSAPRRYRLLLADDHAVFRAGLRTLLGRQADLDVVAEVARREAVLEAVRRTRPDVVVLDVQMPGIGGPAAVAALREAGEEVPVLALSAYEDETYAEALSRHGAAGYVSKAAAPADVVKAIRRVAEGGSAWLVARPVHSVLRSLSERDRRVLVLLAEGYTNEEMAERLGVTESAVRNALTHVYEKLGVTNARAAIAWAWRNRLLGGPGG